MSKAIELALGSDHLYKLRDDSYDRMMSLGGKYHRKFKIFINQDLKEEKTGFYQLSEVEAIQKKYAERNDRMKKRLFGSEVAESSIYKRSESSPPRFGGT